MKQSRLLCQNFGIGHTKRTEETEDMAEGEYIKAHSATISAFNEDGTVTMVAKDGWNEVKEEKYYSQKRNYDKTSIFRKSKNDRQINEKEKKALNQKANPIIKNYEKKVEEIKNKKNNNN